MAGRTAVNLDAVQQRLAARLRPLGFRRKGRMLARAGEAGLLQIIGLQAGRLDIGVPPAPALAHLPGLYGQFTVNLGIFVPDVHTRLGADPSPRGVVTDAHCTIRTRLSRWWASRTGGGRWSDRGRLRTTWARS